MENAFFCLVEKDGLIVAWGGIGVGILIVFVGLLFLIFSISLAIPVLYGRGHGWEIAVKVADLVQVTGRGPGAVVVIALIGLALILGTGYVGSLWASDFRNRYALSFNTGEVPTSLEEVRARYQPKTDVTIKLLEGSEKFAIHGGFKGACATDLLRSICRQYNNELSCKESEQEFTIHPRTAP